jgi:hypothetical protein
VNFDAVNAVKMQNAVIFPVFDSEPLVVGTPGIRSGVVGHDPDLHGPADHLRHRQQKRKQTSGTYLTPMQNIVIFNVFKLFVQKQFMTATPKLKKDICIHTLSSEIMASKLVIKQMPFFVAKPSRTLLFHERNSEPDRCGILYFCQEHSTNAKS